ncbi:MAG: type VII toxin-antitoxin system HepT family RNase toxin [Sulfobacillus sp.]
MTDDILLNKAQIIRRSIGRVEEEYQGKPEHLKNLTRQDSIVLNMQRACEAAIDLAMHAVAAGKMGLPQDSREAFEMLAGHGVIDQQLARSLKAMVGFRNVAVHNDQALDLGILQAIIEQRLGDLQTFADVLFRPEQTHP